MKKIFALFCVIAVSSLAAHAFNFNEFYSVVRTLTTGEGKVYATCAGRSVNTSTDGSSTFNVVAAHDGFLNWRSTEVSWTINAEDNGDWEFLNWNNGDGTFYTSNRSFNLTYQTTRYESEDDAKLNPQGDFKAVFAHKLTLGNIVTNPSSTEIYSISDLTCVYVLQNDDNSGGLLFCKDDNGYAHKDVNSENLKDYVLYNVQDVSRTDHDQSNWVVINVPASVAGETNLVTTFANHKLSKVIGQYDASTMTFTVDRLPVAQAGASYDFNTYIPCNFLGNQKGFFFVTPKPMEVCDIQSAMWDGSHFTVIPRMTSQGNIYNGSGLEGEFNADQSLLDSEVELQEGHIYRFKALVAPNGFANGAKKAAGVQQNLVYILTQPVELGKIVDGIVTGIDDIDAQVVSVKYYNLNGVMSETPHDGVNIVVEILDNGTTKSHKQVF